MDLIIKQHDTAPPLVATLTDGGAVVDLSTASVVKVIGSQNGAVLFTTTTTGSSVGVVTRPWVTGETDTVGTIKVEVEVTWASGKVQTFPNDNYLTVRIRPDLG